MGSVRPRWSEVFDPGAERDRQVARFAPLARYLDEAGRAKLGALVDLVRQKFELDAHASLQRALKGWLVLHVPPAMLLMGLLAVHVLAVLLF
jgi:hypothetical protein